MRKGLFILALIILGFVCWLVFRQSKVTPPPSIAPNLPAATNAPPINIIPVMPKIAANTNDFVRPDSIDEDHWNRLMTLRQIMLAENKPIEFYARIVDQDGMPIAGAMLNLTLSRVDETLFATTNFFHLNAGDEITHFPLQIISDAKGWIALTNTTGQLIQVNGISKDGYSFSMPQIGSFGYSPERAVGVAGMEDAFNAEKGYVFHMDKIGDTNSSK